MKVLILFLSCLSLIAGERLVNLKSGETNLISYSLSTILSDARRGTNDLPGANLILTLRNTGAKWIGMEGISLEDFSLRDANGQELKIYLGAFPSSGMSYGSTSVIHLKVANARAPQPWILRFKSKPKGLVSVDLTISEIKPN
jgi:hypothetical protein